MRASNVSNNGFFSKQLPMSFPIGGPPPGAEEESGGPSFLIGFLSVLLMICFALLCFALWWWSD